MSTSIERSGGFTLIEVMFSVMILCVGSLALGTLLLRGSRAAIAASAVTYQTAALSAEVARLGAIPFSQLPAAGTTCVDVTTGPFLHTRCAAIVDVSAKVRRVTVTVTPAVPNLQPLSNSFERSISGNAVNPLFTP